MGTPAGPWMSSGVVNQIRAFAGTLMVTSARSSQGDRNGW